MDMPSSLTNIFIEPLNILMTICVIIQRICVCHFLLAARKKRRKKQANGKWESTVVQNVEQCAGYAANDDEFWSHVSQYIITYKLR